MASARTFKLGPRAVLAGDGALLMAGACAVLAPLAALFEAAAIPLMVVGLLAPLLAWWLHGRRVDRTATGGAVLGYLAGVGLALGLLGLMALVMLALTAVGLYDTGDDPGKVVGDRIAVIVVGYLALAAWLDVDALRDLAAQRRAHARLDVARLVATAAGVAYIVGVIVSATGHPQYDYIGAILSIGGCGVVGAVVVTVADMMVRRHERRGHGQLVSGADPRAPQRTGAPRESRRGLQRRSAIPGDVRSSGAGSQTPRSLLARDDGHRRTLEAHACGRVRRDQDLLAGLRDRHGPSEGAAA